MRRMTGGALVCALTILLVLPSSGAAAARDQPSIPAPLGASPAGGFAARSVPAYVSSTRLTARVRPGSARTDLRYDAPSGAEVLRPRTVVMGDWDGNGTTTPAVFTDGVWEVWQTVVGRRPKAARRATFGPSGGLPVAGDWDGDGRTDLGVFLDGTWRLARGSADGPSGRVPRLRTVRFGAPGDVPVSGDWDGDGVDGIGVFRSGEWYRRLRPRTGTSDVRVDWGGGAATPVAGDWDGDGVDGLGLVRRSQWRLRNRPDGRTRHREIPRSRGQVPVVWSLRAGPSGAGCPTARAGLQGVGRLVDPPTLLDRDPPADETSRRLAASLRESERFLLGAHYASRWASAARTPYVQVLRRSSRPELAVRGPGMSAVAVAVAVRTGAHRTRVAGRTREEAVRYVDWLVRSLACEHRSITPGGWGGEWQAAHWATLLGLAGWLVWDDLAPQTRGYVARVVTAQARRSTRQPVTYWADRSGTVLTPGNTQAEENSWAVALLELAVDMMPRSRRAAGWRAASVQHAVAAYATQADATSERVVNGVPLSRRLDGFNAYPDHSVENHGRIHPDYATSIGNVWWALDFAGLAGRRVPEAMLHHGRATYDAVATVDHLAGGASPAGGTFLPPGGTVYRVGTNGIYYPQGADWGTVRRAPFISFDAHAAAWWGSGFAWSPDEALRIHLRGQRRLVSSSGADDGRTYSVDPAVAVTQDRYPAREEYAAQQLATAWLARYVSALRRVRVDRSLVRVPDGSAGRGAAGAAREPLSP